MRQQRYLTYCVTFLSYLYFIIKYLELFTEIYSNAPKSNSRHVLVYLSLNIYIYKYSYLRVQYHLHYSVELKRNLIHILL